MSSIEVFNWALVLGCIATATIFLAAMALRDISRADRERDISRTSRDESARGITAVFDVELRVGHTDKYYEHPESTKAREHAERPFPRLHQPHQHIDQYFIGYDPGAESGSFSATWDDYIVKEPTE